MYMGVASSSSETMTLNYSELAEFAPRHVRAHHSLLLIRAFPSSRAFMPSLRSSSKLLNRNACSGIPDIPAPKRAPYSINRSKDAPLPSPPNASR